MLDRQIEVDASSTNAAAEWYGSQPAALLGVHALGSKAISSAPRVIRFAIPGVPAPAYRLHVALLIESRSVPALHICIDGKCGMFYLESPLDARMGDSDDTFESVHAPADVSLVFPGSYLRSGENQITFQVVEDKDDAVQGASPPMTRSNSKQRQLQICRSLPSRRLSLLCSTRGRREA